MPANIEIKARLRDPEALAERAGGLALAPPETLIQEDVFFAARHGRLKLRSFGQGRGELIAYQRADMAGPRQSTYTIAPIDDVASLRTALTDSLGVIGVVRKRRQVYLVGQTRVHVDRVDGLGDFVELEVVLERDQSPGDGERIARQLMAELGIAPDQLVEGAYLDLLLQAG